MPARADAGPAKGKLLVASEDLFDPSFIRTVVLLLDYGETGAVGVILNRPTSGSLKDLLPDADWASQSPDPIYLGGPVGINQALMLSSTGQESPDQPCAAGFAANALCPRKEDSQSEGGRSAREKLYLPGVSVYGGSRRRSGHSIDSGLVERENQPCALSS
ncbi:MAG: hypothetical protein GY769_25180 [bacterium]|nr:hypothetical protein [bacterium]